MVVGVEDAPQVAGTFLGGVGGLALPSPTLLRLGGGVGGFAPTLGLTPTLATRASGIVSIGALPLAVDDLRGVGAAPSDDRLGGVPAKPSEDLRAGILPLAPPPSDERREIDLSDRALEDLRGAGPTMMASAMLSVLRREAREAEDDSSAAGPALRQTWITES